MPDTPHVTQHAACQAAVIHRTIPTIRSAAIIKVMGLSTGTDGRRCCPRKWAGGIVPVAPCGQSFFSN